MASSRKRVDSPRKPGPAPAAPGRKASASPVAELPPGKVPLAAWIAAGLMGAVAFWRLSGLTQLVWAQDDAYISFRFARNLLRGHGLVFNVGERVEGYTNFLWTLLSAIPMAMGRADPIGWMNGLGFAALAGTCAVLIALGLVLARRGLPMAPLALLPLLFTWSFALWFISGMETGLVAFFTVAGAALVALDPERRRWAPWAASLAGVLAMLTRADAAPVWAALAATGIADAWLRARARRKRLAWRAALLPWLAPLALIYVPYTIWRIAYYGSFYPNTYYAKAIYLPAWGRGAQYLATFFSVYPIAPLLLVPPIAAALARDGVVRRFLLAATLITALVMLYVLRVGGDFMEWRFLVPAIGVLLPAIAIGAAVIAARFARRAGPVTGALAALALAALMQARLGAAMTTRMEGQEVIGELARYCDDSQFNFRGVARRFDTLIPKDVRVAVTAAGAIPFFCDRTILDQHGLTDREIARQPIDPAARGRMGHEHYVIDPAELRRRGASAVVVWGNPTEQPEADRVRPPDGMAFVSARIADGRWASFFVIDTTRFALAPLRRAPDVVMAIGDQRIATPATAAPADSARAPR